MYYAELLNNGLDGPKHVGNTLKPVGQSQQQCTWLVLILRLINAVHGRTATLQGPEMY
jgi:hypothetical protein